MLGKLGIAALVGALSLGAATSASAHEGDCDHGRAGYYEPVRPYAGQRWLAQRHWRREERREWRHEREWRRHRW
jgi:hypothetical protein